MQARALPDEKADIWERGPSGVWFTNAYEANDLIGVFDTLRLKAGFALHSFAVRSDGNGRGVIWAVPSDAPPTVPDDSSGLEGRLAGFEKPPEAIPLTQAIEGDGSPWSYLSASILSREAAEFGASWHGCVWTPQTILSKAPRQTQDRRASRREDYRDDAPIRDWTWHSPVPQTWEPNYAEEGTIRRVVLYIRNPVGRGNDLPRHGHLPRRQLRLRDLNHRYLHRPRRIRLLTRPGNCAQHLGREQLARNAPEALQGGEVPGAQRCRRLDPDSVAVARAASCSRRVRPIVDSCTVQSLSWTQTGGRSTWGSGGTHPS